MNRLLAPPRVTGRAVAAHCISRASHEGVTAGEGSCSLRAIASTLCVSHTHMERCANPASGVAITLGDVIAGPRAWSTRALLLSLEHVDGTSKLVKSPLAEVLRVVTRVGKLAETMTEALGDGVVTRAEWQAIAGCLLTVEAMCRSARVACRVAADLAGAP